ncbi:hypothetical protein LTR56_002355 [Elasticomyces elasticus]|nr:hypothetical protein LTR56_002355 [Elasticomyces elasticus]KAK3665919.1 hypothetical protein LTR22_003238 [Elasticomyces elasticus]KAK4929391.1 hypothetical protein LTR49_003995 [Elasticomyces elasticus]KAK5764680.1 hypothetical protein LTS12_005181 [Elasticomyces elasticus]
MAPKPSFEDRLEACINTMLREEYPFTHTSVINGVASETAESVARKIIKRKKACKGGVRPLQFMDLPSELRNRIHEYTVSYYNKRGSAASSVKDDEIVFAQYLKTCVAMQPPITRVSRQLRSETLEMFYAMNRFVLYLEHRPVMDLVQGNFQASKWLRAIGSVNATHIKHFTIRYNPRMLPIPMEEIFAKTGLSLVAGIVQLESRR